MNPAAFAQPAAGTFGTHQRNSIKGPEGHVRADHDVTGDPRIMQFGIKYGF